MEPKQKKQKFKPKQPIKTKTQKNAFQKTM